MDDPVTAHHARGYLWLVLGICLVILTPQVFILLVNDFFEREEERLRLDYALTPKSLREPWFFALKDKVSRALLVFREIACAFWWLAIVTVMIWGGIAMIRQTP